MFGQTGRTAERWRVAVFVGTLLMVGACVQIAGIDDPHPKVKDAGQGGAGQGGAGQGGAGQGGAGQGGGQEPVDREWANWIMPNPQGSGLSNLAVYAIDPANPIVTDKITNLMWQRDVSAASLNWNDAKKYCDELMHGNYTDWRLPTAIELVSLVDFTKVAPGPTIDTNAFPGTPDGWFWTATPLATAPSNAWVVNFGTGETNADDMKLAMYPVRCVR